MARLKPPYKPAIDPRWLGLGLKAAWAFNEGSGTPRDALNGILATLASSDWGSGAQGPVIVHDATTDRTELVAASSALLPTGDVTIVLGSRKTDGTNRDSGAFGVDTATAAEYCAVKLPAADGTVYWDYGGTTAGTTRLTAAGLAFGDDAWGFTVGARGMEIWQNGALRASNSANPTRAATSAAYKLGLYDSALEGDLAAYNCFYVFSGQLSQEDLALLTTDPARLFLDVHAGGARQHLFAAAASSVITAAGIAYEVIRTGRALRPALTRNVTGAVAYSSTQASYDLAIVDATSLVYANEAYALTAPDPVSRVYTDQAHALAAIDDITRVYTDQAYRLDAYTSARGYADAESILYAYTERRGFTDAEHGLAAFLPLHGHLDGSFALNVAELARGYADLGYSLSALVAWRGVSDAAYDLAAYKTSFAYLDAQASLEARLAFLSYLDSEFALDAQALFYAWAINATTGAPSRYEGFDFNSLCLGPGGSYLGAGPGGIYELEGDDDAGAPIQSLVLTGDMDFGSEMRKRVSDAYLGVANDGPLQVSVSMDRVPYRYRLDATGALANRKIPVGRGAKGRYVTVEIANLDGAAMEVDAVEILIERLSRR